MNLKLIKTETDYAAALARIDELFTAVPGTPEGDELEVWLTLVELYEQKEFPIDLPDPIAAIRFRMEQQGLKAKDLIPYIGSGPKVSEVLSGKRALSISMIRKLIEGLHIPAEVLLREPKAHLPSEDVLMQCRMFPFTEMYKRGWFEGFTGSLSDAKGQREELLTRFFGAWTTSARIPALNRQRIKQGEAQDEPALAAWRLRVMNLASKETLPAWKKGTLTPAFLNEVAHLSYLESGPLLAREFLAKNGLHLVFEEHMPGTRLDGAAMLLPDGSPVVALTLRYDRLDYFWFTLFHELAHITLHLEKDGYEVFLDELAEAGKDELEREADAFASGMLIPDEEWSSAGLSRDSSPSAIVQFAERLRISPSIPAGRIRFETRDYRIFTNLVGSGKVRNLFSRR